MMTVVLLCIFVHIKWLWEVVCWLWPVQCYCRWVDIGDCLYVLHVWYICRWKPTSWNCWKRRLILIDIQDGVMSRRSWILIHVTRPSTAVHDAKTGSRIIFAPLRRWIVRILRRIHVASVDKLFTVTMHHDQLIPARNQTRCYKGIAKLPRNNSAYFLLCIHCYWVSKKTEIHSENFRQIWQ